MSFKRKSEVEKLEISTQLNPYSKRQRTTRNSRFGRSTTTRRKCPNCEELRFSFNFDKKCVNCGTLLCKYCVESQYDEWFNDVREAIEEDENYHGISDANLDLLASNVVSSYFEGNLFCIKCYDNQ